MPPEDIELSYTESCSGASASQEVEVFCSIQILTTEKEQSTDNMNRIISSPTKKYSFITRSPRILRSKSMTEYIYFPIISSKSDNISKTWLRNVKSLSSLQGKDEKQMLNEKLKNRDASQQIRKESKVFDITHFKHEYGNITHNEHEYIVGMNMTDIKDEKMDTIELNVEDKTVRDNSAKSYELSDTLTKEQKKSMRKVRSPSMRTWNPPSNKSPVLSSFKPEYNVLQPNSVVALSHQFEKTPSPNKTSIPCKKKVELYDKSDITKRQRIQTDPILEKKEADSSKLRANSLPDEHFYKKNKKEISPKSVKKLRSDWEKKAEVYSIVLSTPAYHNLNLNLDNETDRRPSYEENFIQSARQNQVTKEYKQRVSTSVSNLKNQFERFSTTSPNLTESTEKSGKSQWFKFEKCAFETPADNNDFPNIVTTSMKNIKKHFEQQSLNEKDSHKLKTLQPISPPKASPILNLLAKFDPSISCSSQGRDSTSSSGSLSSENDVFASDENSQSRNVEMESSNTFASRITEKKKKVQADSYLRKREKEKEGELRRLKEQRDRDAIMAEKREVERLKRMEEESEKEQKDKEREQELKRIEAERAFQRKRLKEEKKLEELQRAIDKEKQRIAIEVEVKRAKKLREDEKRKEYEERDRIELKRIEEEKELEVFEREKFLQARELKEAHLQKEKEEKLKEEEKKIKQLQIERGLYSENDNLVGIATEADVDNLINKFEKPPKRNEFDHEKSPPFKCKPLSRGGSTQSLNCRPLNQDELQIFMGLTSTESFMRTQSLRVKPKKKRNSSRVGMKRSNSLSEKSSPILVSKKTRISMGPQVGNKVPDNCRELREEEWKFFLGDMTSSENCDFKFSDSE